MPKLGSERICKHSIVGVVVVGDVVGGVIGSDGVVGTVGGGSGVAVAVMVLGAS